MNKRNVIFGIILITLTTMGVQAVKQTNSTRVEARSVQFDNPVTIVDELSPPEIAPPPVVTPECLGEFKITFYAATLEDCGNTKGITKNGSHVTKDVTVAVDPDIIPLGSYIYIEGYGMRIAQDTGRLIKGDIIDIYVPTHSEAQAAGVKHRKVYIIKEVKK